MATVRDFELRSGPGARQEGALGPRGSGGWVVQPRPAGLGINSIEAAGGSVQPQGVGVFQQVIEETIPDDLRAERAADAVDLLNE